MDVRKRTLTKLQNYISGMRPDHRDQARRALRDLIGVLRLYKVPVTATEVLGLSASAGVANVAGTIDKWWSRLCADAQEIGPDVGAIFHADQGV